MKRSRFIPAVLILLVCFPSCLSGQAQSRPGKNEDQQQTDQQGKQQTAQREQPPPSISAPGSDVAVFDPGSSIARDYLRGGIVLGRALVRPSLDAGIEGDTNFLTIAETRGVSNGVFSVVPGLDVEVPAVRSGFRFTYSPIIRFLNVPGLPASNVAHRLDFDFTTQPSPYIRLAVREHLSKSTFDTLEFDPGREVFFSQKPFWRSGLAVRLDYTASQRSSLGFMAEVNKAQFKGQPEPGDFFFDYTTTTFGFDYSYRLSRRHALQAGFRTGNGDSLRAVNALDPRLNNYRLYEPRVTIQSNLRPTTSGQILLALRVQRFPHAAKNFTGAEVGLSLQQLLSNQVTLSLSALRTSVLSAFNPEQGNAYAVSTGVEAMISQKLGPRISWAAGPDYQRLSFPVPIGEKTTFGGSSLARFAGSKRADHILGARAEIGFRLYEFVTLQVGYIFHQRSSTITPFSFERNRFRMGFSLGRLIPMARMSTRRF